MSAKDPITVTHFDTANFLEGFKILNTKKRLRSDKTNNYLV